VKIGDLVTWVPVPGSVALIIGVYEYKTTPQKVFDLLWSEVPPRLAGIAKDGIVEGFRPWELELIE